MKTHFFISFLVSITLLRNFTHSFQELEGWVDYRYVMLLSHFGHRNQISPPKHTQPCAARCKKIPSGLELPIHTTEQAPNKHHSSSSKNTVNSDLGKSDVANSLCTGSNESCLVWAGWIPVMVLGQHTSLLWSQSWTTGPVLYSTDSEHAGLPNELTKYCLTAYSTALCTMLGACQAPHCTSAMTEGWKKIN